MGCVVVPTRYVVVVVVVGVRGDLLRERRAVVGHPPVAHHDRPVDQRHHRADLVRDQHDGRAALLELAQRVGECLLVGQVDPGRGLVEHEQVRLARERPGDEHPLLLAARQLGDAVRRPVGQADDLERGRDGRPVGRAGRTQQAAPTHAPGGDDLADRGRHAAGRGRALRHEADPLPVTEVVERGPEEPHLAASHRQEPGERADEGGLARPVRAEQRHHVAGVDGQVDVAQDRPAPDRDGDPVEDDGNGGVGRGHEQPLACWRAVRFSRMRER